MPAPEPVEPSAIWRMLTNGHTYDQIATLLHINKPAILKAEQDQNRRLHGVDPQLVADPMIDPK